MSNPVLGPAKDRIYPRCVWCRGENYLPAVLAYSAGEIPCSAAGGCGRYLPEDYRSGSFDDPGDDPWGGANLANCGGCSRCRGAAAGEGR